MVKSTQTVVRVHFAWRPVSRADAHAHQLDVRAPRAGEVAGVASRRELWIESALDNQWIVAYRIAIQRRRAVVSEVRVLPNEPRPRAPGRWSGAGWEGMDATVPTGGLSTRLLRKVRLGHDVHSLSRILEHVQRDDPNALKPEGWLGRMGVTQTTQPKRPRPGLGRGRPPLPALTYAEVAAVYAAAVARGSKRPVEELASHYRQPVALIRSRVQRARALGYLESGVQGTAGGRLMPKAKGILRVKGARHGKKTRKR